MQLPELPSQPSQHQSNGLRDALPQASERRFGRHKQRGLPDYIKRALDFESHRRLALRAIED